jgi:hypothetical protein
MRGAARLYVAARTLLFAAWHVCLAVTVNVTRENDIRVTNGLVMPVCARAPDRRAGAERDERHHCPEK